MLMHSAFHYQHLLILRVTNRDSFLCSHRSIAIETVLSAGVVITGMMSLFAKRYLLSVLMC